MTVAINNALNDAANAIDRIRNDLAFADTRFSRNPGERDRLACLTASAYIWLASAVEQFVKRVLASMLDEINARGIRKDQVKYCLFALIVAGELDSVERAKKLRKWKGRATAFSSVVDPSPVAFNPAVLPIDGRTIRADHLETIWHTFGMRGSHVPHARHSLALTDLADGRNKLAHGETDPVMFGRNKTTTDLRRLVEMIEEIILHLGESALSYLANDEFTR